MTKNKRIGYIDALRGFAMLLVVFAHVEYLCFGIPFDKLLVGSIFVSFHMPLFIFISGYMAHKTTTWNKTIFMQNLKKKSIVLFFPALFFFFILHTACLNEIFTTFFTKGPREYWFTITLFYMFIIYYTVLLLTNKKKPWLSDVILISLAIIGALIYIGGMKFYDLDQYPIFCLINLSRFFEFFVLGILCRKYYNSFYKILSNKKTYTLLLLAFGAIFLITWNQLIIQYSLFHIFNIEFSLRYLGTFLVFSIFFKYRDFFETDNYITKSLCFIGKRTLDIYLLHYFFLPDLSEFVQTIALITKPQNVIIELFTISLITLLIISICLLISAIIRTSPFLGHYLLGAKLTKK